MKAKALLATFVVVTLSVGCAGRAANPVMIQQYGDDKKSCQALESEMAFIQGEIQRLIPTENRKNRKKCRIGRYWVLFIGSTIFHGF